MAVNTINIVGQVLPPTGVPDTRSRVFFIMTGYDTDADDDAVIYPVTGQDDADGFPIAADGTIDVDLWPNQEGERNTLYRVEVSVFQLNRPVRVSIGSISVPNTGGPYSLNDLLGVAPPSDATVEEYIASLASAVSEAESAASTAASSASAAASSASDAAASASDAAASAASIDKALAAPPAWGADTAGTAAANDTAFSNMAAYVGDQSADLELGVYPVTAVPDLPGAEHGFWAIENAGGQEILYPAANTLRTSKGVLAAPLAYASWAQNNGARGLGNEKFVAFTVAENHGSSYDHQTVIGHCDADHWSLDYTWGPGDLSSTLGWFISGLAFDGGDNIAGAVMLAAVRAQNTSGSSDDTYHLFGQTLGSWVDATDVITSTLGNNRLTILSSDLGVRVIEGDEIEIAGASAFGGHSAGDINKTHTVTAVNAGSFYVTSGSTGTSTETGGGTISIRVKKQAAQELTFSGGLSLGAALDGASVALGGDPVMIHGITVDSSGDANIGQSWITWSGDSGGGSGVGVAHITNYYRGASSGTVDWVREITGVDVDTTEPSLVVVDGGTYDGYHIVTLRIQNTTDGWQCAVSDDEWATAGTVTTGAGDFVTKSPLPICQIGDYIFGTCTGNRGDTVAQGNDGFRTVDVYLMVATIADVVASGAAAFQFIKVSEAQEFNHASGISDAEVSPVGVGTITPMGDHVCIYYGQGRRLDDPAQPMSEIIEMKLDVTPWVGGAPRVDLSATESPSAYLSMCEYTGSGAVATGGAFAPATRKVDTMPGAYNPSTGTFTPRTSGHYRVTVKAYLTSDGTAQHMGLYYADGGAEYDDPYSIGENPYLVFQGLPVSSEQLCNGSETYYLEAGVGVYVEVSDGAIISSTVRNSIRWEYVG